MNVKFDFVIQKASGRPLYVQIQDELRNAIVQGRLMDGEQLPPVQLLAEQLNVSLFTMEKSLQTLLKEGFLIRRPKKGTFVQRPCSKKTAPKIANLIYVVAEQENMPPVDPHLYTANTMAGLLAESEKWDISLVFCTLKSLEEHLHDPILQPGLLPRGIVLFHPSQTDHLKDIAQAHPQVPVVVVGRQPSDFMSSPDNFYGVFNDDFGGGYQMARYLVDQRYHDFAVVSRRIVGENYQQRVQGILKAFQDTGIYLPKERVIEDLSNPNNLDAGREGAERLLETGLSGKTVVICVNDLLATGVLSKLRSLSDTSLSQLLVTGYDHVELDRQHPDMFATIAIDYDKIGKMAIQTLTGNSTDPRPKAIRITPQLIRYARVQPVKAQFGTARGSEAIWSVRISHDFPLLQRHLPAYSAGAKA